MGPTRRSNRALKPRDFYDPPLGPTPRPRGPPRTSRRQRQPLLFNIFTETFNKQTPDSLPERPRSRADSVGSGASDPEDLGPEPPAPGPELLDPAELLRRALEPCPLEPAPLDSTHEHYEPPFLPGDWVGQPLNLPENRAPLQLFQLFFPVKAVEDIVKHSNARGARIFGSN